MTFNRLINRQLLSYLCLALALLILSGCAKKDLWSSGEEGTENLTPESLPYFTNDFRDILVPSELQWDRSGSMSIKTESFAGGVLKFTGRVEVNSLTDFFVNSMSKNNWKLVGSAKYKNILLAFTKPEKNSMIIITESDLMRKTDVYIYITDDITARKGMSPFSSETLR